MEGRREGGERKVGREGGVEGGRKKRREEMPQNERKFLTLINAKWEKKKKSDLDVFFWFVKVLLLLEMSHIACTYGIPRNV